MDALVAGAAIEDKLYLILYTGARIHYYPKYRDHVEQLLASIEMIWRRGPKELLGGACPPSEMRGGGGSAGRRAPSHHINQALTGITAG